MAILTTQLPATTHYVYDRAGRMIAEAAGTGTIQREYVWLDDMLLATVADVDTASPELWYVHPDQSDRPSKMTDGSQAVVWDAWYWPYGEARSITGTATLPLENPTTVRALHAVLAGALNTSVIKATVAELNRTSAAELAAGIRTGILVGQVRADIDPDMQGVLTLASLRGAVAQWIADPERIDLPRLGENFIAMLKRSLVK